MILVLDDHPIVRQGLVSIIKMYKHDEIILEAGTVKEAIVIFEDNKRKINMAFIDINLRNEDGFDLIEWINKKGLDVKKFMITSSSKEEDFIRAKALGVDAYLLKDAFIDDIVYGLKVVDRGGKFYSADLIENIGNVTDEDKLINSLTKREMEVLFYLHKGYTNAKISESLHISEGTTKKHISNLLSKLGLENRVNAVLFANRNSIKLRNNTKYGEDFIKELIKEEKDN